MGEWLVQPLLIRLFAPRPAPPVKWLSHGRQDVSDTPRVHMYIMADLARDDGARGRHDHLLCRLTASGGCGEGGVGTHAICTIAGRPRRIESRPRLFHGRAVDLGGTFSHPPVIPQGPRAIQNTGGGWHRVRLRSPQRLRITVRRRAAPGRRPARWCGRCLSAAIGVAHLVFPVAALQRQLAVKQLTVGDSFEQPSLPPNAFVRGSALDLSLTLTCPSFPPSSTEAVAAGRAGVGLRL